MEQPEKICEYCGGTFTPERASKKYCSPTCNQYAYLKRKEEDVVQETTTVQKLYRTSEHEKINQENKSDDTIKVQSIQPVPAVVEKNEVAEDKKEVKEKLPSINNQVTVNPPPKELNFDEKLQKEIETKTFFWDFYRDFGRWSETQWEASKKVNEQLRVFIERILLLEEKEVIYISQLKELRKSINELFQSRTFKELHSDYPHIKLIPILIEKIENVISLQEAKFQKELRLEFSEDFEVRLLGTLQVIKQEQKKMKSK